MDTNAMPFRIAPALLPLMWLVIATCYPKHRQHILHRQRSLVNNILHSTFLTNNHQHKKSSNDEFADQHWLENAGVFLAIAIHVGLTITGMVAAIIESRGVVVMKFGVPILVAMVCACWFCFRSSTTASTRLYYVQIFSIAMTVPIAMMAALARPDSIAPSIPAVKRSLVFRALANLFLFESLEDSLCALATIASANAMALLAQEQSIHVVLVQFAWLSMLIILITLTSIRGRMLVVANKIIHSQYRNSSIKFLGAVVACAPVVLAMCATLIDRPKDVDRLKLVLLLFHVIGALMAWQWAARVEGRISPVIAQEGLYRQLNVVFADALPSLLQMVGMAAFYALSVVVVSMQKVALVTILVVLIGGMMSLWPSFAAMASLRYNETMARVMSLLACLTQLAMLAMCVTTIPGRLGVLFADSRDENILMLGTIRTLTLSLSHTMTFPDLCLFTLLISAASIVAAESSLTVIHSLGLSLLQFLMGLESSVVRRSILAIAQSNTEAQRFVDHALKQKFVGCLDAVSDILAKRKRQELSEEQVILLKQARQVCAFGLDRTYYHTLLHRYSQASTFGGEYRTASLNEVVQEWKTSWGEDIEWIMGGADDVRKYAIRNRWNLIRLVLHRLLGHVHTNVIVTYSLHLNADGVNAKIEFIMTQKRATGAGGMRRHFTGLSDYNSDAPGQYVVDPVIAKAVQVSSVVSDDRYTLHVSFDIDRNMLSITTESVDAMDDEDGSSSSSDKLPSPSGITFVPQQLVFAILDDIKLVRLNVRRYLVTEFHASEETFALGATKEEATVEFMQRCLTQHHVDVALIDQNLEYDDEVVMGTSIAKKLRESGFKGTIILHSANDKSITLLGKDVHHVDGFLEKRAFDRKYVGNCILNAMKKRREQNVLE